MPYNALIAAGRAKKKVTRRKTGAKAKKQKSNHSLLIGKVRLLATLAVAALFILTIYSLATIELNPASTSQSNPSKHNNTGTDQQKSSAEKTEVQGKHKKPEYTFYSRLKDFTIDVPKFEQDNVTKTPQKNITYIIQAGSFKTNKQAEQRLVELKLMGLSPNIDENINSRGEKWHRVLLGPFSSRSGMANARTIIISNHIDALVMERK